MPHLLFRFPPAPLWGFHRTSRLRLRPFANQRAAAALAGVVSTTILVALLVVADRLPPLAEHSLLAVSVRLLVILPLVSVPYALLARWLGPRHWVTVAEDARGMRRALGAVAVAFIFGVVSSVAAGALKTS